VTGSRRLAAVLDALPVLLLAGIAGAGSFAHIRDTAAQHGQQRGPMATAVAVCIDLTCVMAARERQRDKNRGVTASRVSWPTIVLAAGILLSLAANLAQAQPTAWGRVMAAVPAGAFLVAVSMLKRRAAAQRRPAGPAPVPVPPAVPDGDGVPDGPSAAGQPAGTGAGAALVESARRAAADHQATHGQPITRDALRARLAISNQAASGLLRQIRTPAGEEVKAHDSSRPPAQPPARPRPGTAPQAPPRPRPAPRPKPRPGRLHQGGSRPPTAADRRPA